MTGGGDTDAFEELPPPGGDAADDAELDFNENDTDPTAGASDIGGRAGDPQEGPAGR